MSHSLFTFLVQATEEDLFYLIRRYAPSGAGKFMFTDFLQASPSQRAKFLATVCVDEIIVTVFVVYCFFLVLL